jgi:hypothetical protein
LKAVTEGNREASWDTLRAWWRGRAGECEAGLCCCCDEDTDEEGCCCEEEAVGVEAEEEDVDASVGPLPLFLLEEAAEEDALIPQ